MFNWPLMVNNVSRLDLDLVIEHLKLDDPKLTHGPRVRDFEQAWSKWLGVKYSVMVNSGASANDLTMLAIKQKFKSGEIILPPLTWVSDVASVLNSGLDPVFVDINLKNLSFDMVKLRDSVTEKTKAIFLTHVLGINGITQELLDFCEDKNLLLVEDVCESHGAKFEGKKVGSIGFASNFSFYYAHHMTTIEGGIISTNDEEFYEMVRSMRSHGMVREFSSESRRVEYAAKHPDLNPVFIFAYATHNMRPTEINGIIGLSQLTRLDENIEKRTENFKVYLENIDRDKFLAEFVLSGSSCYAFPIILKNADASAVQKIENFFRTNKIEFRRGLSGGGSQIRQPYLIEHGVHLSPGDYPNVEHIHFNSWYVGNYPGLEKVKIKKLCQKLNSL